MTTAERLTQLKQDFDDVYNAGRRSQHDEFWDAFQNNGNRDNYQYAFGDGWNNINLKPKYDIKPISIGAAAMFKNCGFSGNLKEHFEKLGITIDTSGATSVGSMFQNADKITEVPFLDLSTCTNTLGNTFNGCTSLVTLHLELFEINKPVSTTFKDCQSLTDLTIDGTIVYVFNLEDSPKLTAKSIVSVINALSSKNGGSLTLSETAVNNAFTNDEWDALVETKPNWTISLM